MKKKMKNNKVALSILITLSVVLILIILIEVLGGMADRSGVICKSAWSIDISCKDLWMSSLLLAPFAYGPYILFIAIIIWVIKKYYYPSEAKVSPKTKFKKK